MTRKCILGCERTNVPLISLPKSAESRQNWIENIKVADIYKSSVICANHFECDVLYHGGTRVREGGNPTLSLGYPEKPLHAMWDCQTLNDIYADENDSIQFEISTKGAFASEDSSNENSVVQIFLKNPHDLEYQTSKIFEAIREYESNPVFERIAQQLNCNASQIKEAVLQYYHDADYHSNGPTTKEPRITEFDLKTLIKSTSIQEPNKPSSFNCVDLVRENSPNQNAKSRQRLQIVVRSPKKNLNEIDDHGEPSAAYENIDYDMESSNSNSHQNATPIIASVDSDEEIEEDSMILHEVLDSDHELNEEYSELEISPEEIPPQSDVTPFRRLSSSDTDLEIIIEERDISTEQLQPLPDITTCQEALQYLKVLEDFAMLKLNYRAIGLISHLEEVFTNPPTYTDCEG